MICKSVDAAIAVVKIMVQASRGGVCQASDRQKAVDGCDARSIDADINTREVHERALVLAKHTTTNQMVVETKQAIKDKLIMSP
jgi:hypothetical protein